MELCGIGWVLLVARYDRHDELRMTDIMSRLKGMNGKMFIKKNTRGFLPVTIDIETSGSDVARHGILEIAAVIPVFTDSGLNSIIFHRHTTLDEGDEVDPASSLVHGIPIENPFRLAIPIRQMLQELDAFIREHCDALDARRGMIVAHNPSFDMAFIHAACVKHDVNVFMHKYTLLDTASMGMMRHHETVLATLCRREGLGFAPQEAHSALYDAHMTARLYWSFMGQVMHKNIQEAIIV